MICPNGHESTAEDFCDTCGAKIDPAAQPARSGPSGSEGSGSASEGGAGAAAAPTDQTCPNCQTVNPVDALFCEACGYDFTTGALPRGAEPAASTTEGSPETPASGSLDLDPVGDPQPTEPSTAEPSTAEPSTAEPSTGGAGVPAAGAGGIAPRIPLEWVAEVWVDPDWYAGQEADEPMPSPGLPAVVPLTIRSILVGRVSASRNIHPDIDCANDTGVSRRHAQLSTDGSRWFVEDLASSNGTFVGPASGPLPDDPIAVGPRTELDGDDRVYVGAWTRIVVRRATDDERAAVEA
ncbi:MAG: FHA domain-containing protein [Lapillicoccus sp.]